MSDGFRPGRCHFHLVREEQDVSAEIEAEKIRKILEKQREEEKNVLARPPVPPTPQEGVQ